MQQTVTVETSPRQAAINGLAVVGFIALVFIGIVLAIYAARYVPVAVSRITSAVYLSGQNSNGDTSLQVVPTIPFDDASTTPAATATSTTATTTPAKPVTPSTTSTGKPTTTAYPIGGTKVPVTGTLYGLPNLTTTVIAVGYVDDNNNFVADNTINSSQALAVKFRITNTGTNTTGPWRLHASIPTRSNGTFEFNSDQEESLVPNQVVDFTLHLDPRDVKVGNNQEIDITADSDHDVKESNENDNDATAIISVTQ
jgi:hypothetical protein